MPEKMILCIRYADGMQREFPEHLVKKTGYLSRMGWSVLEEVEMPPVNELKKVVEEKPKQTKARKVASHAAEAILNEDEFQPLPEDEENETDKLNNL